MSNYYWLAEQFNKIHFFHEIRDLYCSGKDYDLEVDIYRTNLIEDEYLQKCLYNILNTHGQAYVQWGSVVVEYTDRGKWRTDRALVVNEDLTDFKIKAFAKICEIYDEQEHKYLKKHSSKIARKFMECFYRKFFVEYQRKALSTFIRRYQHSLPAEFFQFELASRDSNGKKLNIVDQFEILVINHNPIQATDNWLSEYGFFEFASKFQFDDIWDETKFGYDEAVETFRMGRNP